MTRYLALLPLALAAAATPAFAAGAVDPAVRAASVCAACHGPEGVSVADHIPNLAGQRAAYLAAQLAAFRDGSRKSEVMAAIAGQLAEGELQGLAEHFAALAPPPRTAAKAPYLPAIAATHVKLPVSFDQGYGLYLTKTDAQSGTVAQYWASEAALAAAAAGRPLPDGSAVFVVNHAARKGSDGKPLQDAGGQLVAGEVVSYAAMARERGWGEGIPQLLRNEDWNYAVFNARGQLSPAPNLAECLACHKSQAASSYLYLHEELAAGARRLRAAH